jgi:hypothetical protein
MRPLIRLKTRPDRIFYLCDHRTVELRPPQLQASGVGIPSWQCLAGKYVYLPLWCLCSSWERTPDALEAQAGRLLQGAASLGDELLRRRVLIPPLVGLEDSSRYDSYAMVLEHLTIVGHAVARIVVDLGHGRRHAVALRTADVKAQGLAEPAEVVAGYREMLAAFRHAALDALSSPNAAVGNLSGNVRTCMGLMPAAYGRRHQRTNGAEVAATLRARRC